MPGPETKTYSIRIRSNWSRDTDNFWDSVVLGQCSVGTVQCWDSVVIGQCSVGTVQCWDSVVLGLRSVGTVYSVGTVQCWDSVECFVMLLHHATISQVLFNKLKVTAKVRKNLLRSEQQLISQNFFVTQSLLMITFHQMVPKYTVFLKRFFPIYFFIPWATLVWDNCTFKNILLTSCQYSGFQSGNFSDYFFQPNLSYQIYGISCGIPKQEGKRLLIILYC